MSWNPIKLLVQRGQCCANAVTCLTSSATCRAVQLALGTIVTLPPCWARGDTASPPTAPFEHEVFILLRVYRCIHTHMYVIYAHTQKGVLRQCFSVSPWLFYRTGFELRDLPDFASRIRRLKACATTAWLYFFNMMFIRFFFHTLKIS